MKAAEVFIGKAKKYNGYYDQKFYVPDHSCSKCMRRVFSFPYTCEDGWPKGDSKWKDQGFTCMNWTDNPKAPVD